MEVNSVFRREPTSDEVEEANKGVLFHESAFTSLRHQIRGLQDQIARLQNLQAQHLRSISQHKGVTTLARRIPSELLAKIFGHCVEDGWTRAPIVASHVCSQWREATKAYPRVWSTIYVNMDSADAIGRTRFWLQRAAKAPLNIVLVATWRAYQSYLMNVMDLLIRHADQWNTLSVEMPMLRQIQLVASQCSRASITFPMLAETRVTTEVHFDDELDGNGDIVDLRSAFDPQRAPNLTTFTFVTNVLPQDINYPLAIRSLDLSLSESPAQRPLSASSLITLLQSFPSLVNLTLSMPLDYEHPYVHEQDPSQMVFFESLDTLTLYGPTNLNLLLQHLCAPSLRELHLRSLEDAGYRQEPLGPSLLTFIHNSENLSNTLECLELHDIDLSPNFFNLCFASLRNLRELRLHESSISDETLASLNADPNGGLCPNLTRLDLRWCGHLRGKGLVDLVWSRMFPKAPNTRSGSPLDNDITMALTDLDQREFSPISQVTVINCCFVEEQDVFSLASMTSCRVIPLAGDYCGKFLVRFLTPPKTHNHLSAAGVLCQYEIQASASYPLLRDLLLRRTCQTKLDCVIYTFVLRSFLTTLDSLIVCLVVACRI